MKNMNSDMETAAPKKKSVLFFAKLHDKSILERNEFYAVDIQILRELGWHVICATEIKEIVAADLYFVWWWTWCTFPLVRAKLAGSPIITVGVFDHITANNELEAFYKRNVLHRWLIRKSLKYSDANVFCSKLELEFVSRRFDVKYPQFAHCAVDIESYKPGGTSRESFILSFCWMNAFNPIRKCVRQSIKAFSRIREQYPDYRFLIAGEKLEGYPPLQEYVHSLGIDKYVSFIGVVSRAEKIRLMQTCAVYLQPTMVEGFGLAIAEAMACSAPVITSPVGTVPEVVGDAAIMVIGIEESQIAAALLRLLKDQSLREEFGERGRQRIVERFKFAQRKEKIALVIENTFNES